VALAGALGTMSPGQFVSMSTRHACGDVFFPFGPALIALLVAGAVLALAAGGFVGAWIGHTRGRPWLGAACGVAAVLALGGAWIGVTHLRTRLETRAAEAARTLDDDVRAPLARLAPGLASAALDALAAQPRSAAERAAQLDTLAWRLAAPRLRWSEADLRAVEAFVGATGDGDARVQSAAQRVRASVLWVRHGDAGFDAAAAACAAPDCRVALDALRARHDDRLTGTIVRDPRYFAAAPLDDATRAALARRVARERAGPHARSTHVAALAWEHLRPGRVRDALRVCGAGYPVEGGAAEWACLRQVIDALETHGARRLCPASGTLDADDAVAMRELLAWMERSSGFVPAWQRQRWRTLGAQACASASDAPDASDAIARAMRPRGGRRLKPRIRVVCARARRGRRVSAAAKRRRACGSRRGRPTYGLRPRARSVLGAPARRYSPMSSFQSCGWRRMNSCISATQRGSSTTVSATPRLFSSASSPRNVRFSPITTRGTP
jgi:hypothetical protein